jgi:hypothetical protein
MVAHRESQLVSVSLSFPGDSISHEFFGNQFMWPIFVVSCVRARIMTAPCSWRIGPLATLQIKPQHGTRGTGFNCFSSGRVTLWVWIQWGCLQQDGVSLVQRALSKENLATIDEMKEVVLWIWRNIPPFFLGKLCRSLSRHMRAVSNVDGGPAKY